jgi:hypothetical protein
VRIPGPELTLERKVELDECPKCIGRLQIFCQVQITLYIMLEETSCIKTEDHTQLNLPMNVEFVSSSLNLLKFSAYGNSH